jgi:hypothetical protein
MALLPWPPFSLQAQATCAQRLDPPTPCQDQASSFCGAPLWPHNQGSMEGKKDILQPSSVCGDKSRAMCERGSIYFNASWLNGPTQGITHIHRSHGLHRPLL